MTRIAILWIGGTLAASPVSMVVLAAAYRLLLRRPLRPSSETTPAAEQKEVTIRAPRIALCTAAILAAGPALAQSMSGDMKGMPGMTGMDKKAPAAKTGHGVGVITAIDPQTAKLTIQHGPMPAVGWPAMTMAFKANPPTLLRGLQVGQRIGFDVMTHGMAAEITAVRPQ
ncbi:copper-binding protein [Sphingobium psychrophilum]|jgi:Cu(I)/Ag(I) efflux system protein CusF|nr:copper-binding protein [Sphingobium psychrophilum]